jgi:hypothetical protein
MLYFMANKTILDKLNELQDAKEDIQAAIREKGGVVSDDTLAGLADDIRDIPQDGYAWGSIGWSAAPDEWADMVADAKAYKDAWDALEIKPLIREYFKYNPTIQMMPFLEEFNTTHEVQGMFQSCIQLKYLPKEATFENATNTSNLFFSCVQLRSIPKNATFENTTVASGMFQSCSQLRSAANVKLCHTDLTNLDNCFNGCALLEDIGEITATPQWIGSIFNGCHNLKSIPLMDWTLVKGLLSWCQNNADIRFCLIKNLGKSNTTTFPFNFNGLSNWGENSDDYPTARQSLIDTLITYSYDRATNSMATATIQLHANAKARLTAAEIASITAKGFTLA